MSDSRRKWPSLPSWPAGRAGGAVLVVVLLAALLAVGVGIGYSVPQQLLGDGSNYLPSVHSLVHVNGATNKVDAELGNVATGQQRVRTIRLPDGTIAVVNNDSRTTTIVDAATMEPAGPPVLGRPDTEPIRTDSGGYLVSRQVGTVQELAPLKRVPAAPVQVPHGILDAVPAGNSLWVRTGAGDIVEINAGRLVQTIRLDQELTGMTVADGHPVAVTKTGRVYLVAPGNPRPIGELGLPGHNLVLGSWRGAGRYVLAVDRLTYRVAALDPRTHHVATGTLPVQRKPQLDAPVVLDKAVYIPDYAGPYLWRFDADTGSVKSGPKVYGKSHSPFDLEVSGGRVWANDQYERFALTIDPSGHTEHPDKGPGEGQGRDSLAGGPKPKRSPTQAPSPGGPVQVSPVPSVSPVPPGGGNNGAPARGMVPAVVGLRADEACRLIQRASLKCVRRISQVPADDPGRLNVVSAQTPEAGTKLPDKKVAITYPDSVTMPALQGQLQGEACSRFIGSGLDCHAAPGSGATAGHTVGAVYQQTPSAGTVIKTGMTVRVTYYSGTGRVRDYTGQPIDAACAQVEADGFVCVRVVGVTANGTSLPPGTVYQQAPPAGTVQDVGKLVTLTFYKDTNTVPSLVGLDRDAACGQLQASGFVCADQQQLVPDYRVVKAQDVPASGEQKLGAAVTITWSPYSPVLFSIVQSSPAVWTLLQGPGTYAVGTAYGPGAGIPGGRTINLFTCGGATACANTPQNQWYSALQSYPGWVNNGPVATLMTCTPNLHPIYRVWKGENEQRRYSITDNPAAWGALDSELLGCTW